MINEFWTKWQLWPKNVITQILQRLYYLIFTLESGHYTAYCYSQVYGKWYKYDDTEVYEMDQSDVKSPAAYILFYSAKN